MLQEALKALLMSIRRQTGYLNIPSIRQTPAMHECVLIVQVQHLRRAPWHLSLPQGPLLWAQAGPRSSESTTLADLEGCGLHGVGGRCH